MQPYNPEAKCQKCGCTGIKNEFRVAGSQKVITYFAEGYWNQTIDTAHEDCIERTCMNCGFSWKEAPLDAPSDKEVAKE